MIYNKRKVDVWYIITCEISVVGVLSLVVCYNPAPRTTAAASTVDSCSPSPCGSHSLCRSVNGHAVCSCEPGCIGAPPNCRPECTQSSECSANKACVKRKCIDPCPDTCAMNARCHTVNHQPLCDCLYGYTGDGFKRCFPITSKTSSITLFYYHTPSINI